MFEVEPVLLLVIYDLVSVFDDCPLFLVLLDEFVYEKSLVGGLYASVPDEVHLLVLLLNLVDFTFLCVELAKCGLDVADDRLFLLPLLLDLVKAIDERAIQVIESHFDDVAVLLLLNLSVFLEVNYSLLLLLLFLLSGQEVRDQLVQPAVLALPYLLTLHLLLLIH